GAGSGFSATLNRPDSQVPYKITFQGRLTNNAGQPITVATAFSFKLYDAPSGGNLLFTENATITPDAQGLLTYQIGTATAINITLVQKMANKLYLGVTVGSDAEMNPRLELTFAPYAGSLIPGAVIQASLPQASQAYYGVVNGINDDYTDPSNVGLFGRGAQGVSGASTAGYGVFGNSSGSSGSSQSAGVVGQSTAGNGYGGVFTDTAGSYGRGIKGTGSTSVGTGVEGSGYNGVSGFGTIGVVGAADNTASSEGVDGSAYSGTSSSVGGLFNSYQGSATNVGLHVFGKGTATGGFSTGLGYGMMVRYDGKAPLHAGDVVVADGNNSLLNDTQILGVDKASPSNAAAALGIVHHRYLLAIHSDLPGKPSIPYTDDQATSFGAGDLIEIVIAGQAQVKVDGQAHIGDRLAITASGSLSAAKGSGESIGKLVGLPDKDGYATVFVNLK
ncbi:MAG: hypothetical protein DLM69_01120, partial [Candidatus Chloroheliales bacterium]